MNMIHAEKLVYEYDKRDDEGNVIGTNRAIDGVDIDVPQGSFCGGFSVITVRESLLLQSI